MGDPLGQLACVDEDQRAAMLVDELHQPLINLGPVLVRANGLQLELRALRRPGPCRGSGRCPRSSAPVACAPTRKLRQLLERLLRRRQADANRPRSQQSASEPLQRQRQMDAALVASHGVDFIDDHRLDVAQNFPASLASEEQIERFRSRDENVRRPAEHLLPLLGRRIARADQGANLLAIRMLLPGQQQNLGQRPLQIALNVVRQGTQRRDVNDIRLLAQLLSSASCNSRSRLARNAVSVLPEPVGAAIRVSCRP